jgi:hypothetical protein
MESNSLLLPNMHIHRCCISLCFVNHSEVPFQMVSAVIFDPIIAAYANLALYKRTMESCCCYCYIFPSMSSKLIFPPPACTTPPLSPSTSVTSIAITLLQQA